MNSGLLISIVLAIPGAAVAQVAETIDDLIAAMKKQLATPRSINGWKRYVP